LQGKLKEINRVSARIPLAIDLTLYFSQQIGPDFVLLAADWT
jgi:hypothetical protein